MNFYTNIKQYLNQKHFSNCNSVQLNWVHRSDSDKLYYENIPLKERFKQVGNNVNKNKSNILCNVKTIIKGHLKRIVIEHNHLLTRKFKGCNGYGKPANLSNFLALDPDYDNFYNRLMAFVFI